jgi:hypothetical protein
MFRKIIKLCPARRVHKRFALVVEQRLSWIPADFSLGPSFTLPWTWNVRFLPVGDNHLAVSFVYICICNWISGCDDCAVY